MKIPVGYGHRGSRSSALIFCPPGSVFSNFGGFCLTPSEQNAFLWLFCAPSAPAHMIRLQREQV